LSSKKALVNAAGRGILPDDMSACPGKTPHSGRNKMNDQVKTSPGSIWSLVLGILGITCCSVFTAIPAVICGHVALSKIKKSAGALAGEGLAIAGLVLGYIGIALAVVLIPMQLAIAIPSFMKARSTSQKNACINSLRQIEAAKDQYSIETGRQNGWDFENANAAAAVLGEKYLKQYPACPLSSDASPKGSLERFLADYEVNPVGSNTVCRQCPDHRLP